MKRRSFLKRLMVLPAAIPFVDKILDVEIEPKITTSKHIITTPTMRPGIILKTFKTRENLQIGHPINLDKNGYAIIGDFENQVGFVTDVDQDLVTVMI